MTCDTGFGFVVWIPIPIVPKARPRVTRRGTYKPDRYAANLASVGLLLRAGAPRGWPLDRSYEVLVEAAVDRRNGGDVDNLLGTVMDAGNKILWLDDCQVASAKVRKFLHDSPIEPNKARVEVRLTEPTGFEPKTPARPLSRKATWARERGGATPGAVHFSTSRIRTPADARKGPSRASKGQA